MFTWLTGKFLAALLSMIIGAFIAAVTIVGVVTHGVDAGPSNPAKVDSATIPYGSTQ